MAFTGTFGFHGKKKTLPLSKGFTVNSSGTVFFSPVKTKSARESHFCPFFRFSSRVEKLFHGHFFRFFPVFFTGTQIGFTGRIYQKSYHFRGENCSNFSRAPIFISRVEFDENLHGHDFAFTGTFLAKTSFFSREVFFFFFTKKINTVPVAPANTGPSCSWGETQDAPGGRSGGRW